jgi:hypothetical protein
MSLTSTSGRAASNCASAASTLAAARTRAPRSARMICSIGLASASSSTTRISSPSSGSLKVDAGSSAPNSDIGAASPDSGSMGSHTSNVLPWPRPSLRTPTRPPWASTSCLTMDSPGPRPPRERLLAASLCAKRSNTNGRKSAAMPCPASTISMRSPSASSVSTAVTTPPRGENLIALVARFQITCCNRSASARISRYGGCWRSSRRMSLSSNVGCNAPSAATSSSAGSIIARDSGSLPRFRRDMSSRSAIMRAGVRPLRSMAARPRWASSVPPRFCSTCVELRIALSGVRSSCDRTAMKSSFMRLVCSASPRAMRSRSSHCTRWRSSSTRAEMSVATTIVTPGSICAETFHST